MLKRFVEWLDELLADEGSAAVVRAVVGLMSFAVLLGAVLGNTVAKAGALVAAIFSVLSSGLLLLADRCNLVRQVEMHKELVPRYSKIVADDRHPSYAVMTWEEYAAIEPNGDARKQVTIRAKVLNDLRVLRLVQGCGWAQPARYRRKVRVQVRKLLVGDLPGASLTTTVAWLRNGQLVLMVHLPEPPKVGSELTIAVEFTWPGMCAPLMRDRRPDRFQLRFATPVTYARYSVVLPRGYNACVEPVGFKEHQNGYSCGPVSNEDGRPMFLFEGFDLPVHEPVGMRLDAQPGSGVGSIAQRASAVLRLVICRMEYGLTALRLLFARRPA
ncbi:hypothetical protein LZG04_34655 [Saccharothrix sp. S26]|uniref:hypothetical protein n=1 Tax=Saccharothrix sp. S26 TaxID=2907215 RepID=UPI001F25F19A|nr:hypothetical protein [Saccharothrix sp. S26]MCE6999919.1 hypothetical protein [Saccharothrix sp. S26]